MEIRPLRETESRLEVRRIYEESWKSAYRGIVSQAYLDGIPAGRWAEALDRPGWDTLVLTVGERLAGTSCASAISSNTKGPRETGGPGAAMALRPKAACRQASCWGIPGG